MSTNAPRRPLFNAGQPFGDELRKQIVQDKEKLIKMVRKLIALAIDGDMRAISLIVTRLDGVIPNIITVTHPEYDALERVEMSEKELTSRLLPPELH